MDYIFFTDADLQFDMQELKRFVPHVFDHDAVIGYRNPRKDPRMRLANAWGWKKLIDLLFHLKVKDIDCAFKLFKKDVFKAIHVESRGAMVSAELLIKMKKSGMKIYQIPVSHYPRRAGSPTGAKPAVIFKAFAELISSYNRLKS
jgi:hypothetical protein